MFHLITQSSNAKVGLGVAVSTSTAATCPDACPLKKAGCYADSGPLAIHWRKVTQEERGHVWNAFIKSVQALPMGWKFRHNQAGDLPGKNNRINRGMLRQLSGAIASRSLRAWTYTHKPLTAPNVKAIREANAAGFVVNLSADNLREADRKAATGLPTVVILPRDAAPVNYTPEGRKVITCPAQTREGTTCASCMLCQRGNRSVIIGFKAHGTGAKKSRKDSYHPITRTQHDRPQHPPRPLPPLKPPPSPRKTHPIRLSLARLVAPCRLSRRLPCSRLTLKPQNQLDMKPISEIQDHTEAAAILAEEFAALNWHATNVTGGHLATDESGWKHYAWQVNFCPPQKGIISMPYKCGTGHATKVKAAWQTPRPVPPKPCEVLACYCRDYRDSDCAFDSWCDEFGYDQDSRKAFGIYEECRAAGPKLKAMGLNREQITRFAELSAML